jgi:hypothetical protein
MQKNSSSHVDFQQKFDNKYNTQDTKVDTQHTTMKEMFEMLQVTMKEGFNSNKVLPEDIKLQLTTLDTTTASTTRSRTSKDKTREGLKELLGSSKIAMDEDED